MAQALNKPEHLPLRDTIWRLMTPEEQQFQIDLLDRIERLEKRVHGLSLRLQQDSTNSHKPPSSDPDWKKKRREKRKNKVNKRKKKGGRKPGGQKGHPGKSRALLPIDQVDHIRHHRPETCQHCQAGLDGAQDDGNPLPHQQFELPPIDLECFHHWLHTLICPHCGGATTARIPPEARTGQGARLTALIGLMVGKYRLSRSQVAEMLDDLFGVKWSKATIQAAWARAASALKKPVEALEAALAEQAAVFLDETGWKQQRVKHWMWVAVAEHFTVFAIHRRRGRKQLEKWFKDGFRGFAHSDRWSAYSLFKPHRRQLCWSHLGRDLQAIIEAAQAGAGRAKAMRVGEKQMFRSWHRFKAGVIDRPGLKAETATFVSDFRAFCEAGAAQTADDKWRKLGKSLLKLWPAVFNFLTVEGLEPTNNAAERALRGAVIWRRTSQGTRTDEGSQLVGWMLSAVATCRQQHWDILDFLTAALRAHLSGRDPPDLLIAQPVAS